MEFKKKTVPQQQPVSDLDIQWDHYSGEQQTSTHSSIGFADSFIEEEEPYVYSGPTDIDQDIEILRKTGFTIDYPDGILGWGLSGNVYRGFYGSSGNVEEFYICEPNRRFAVKIINFGDSDNTYRKRERFETEKFVLTDVNHRNVITVKMIINMGEHRSFRFQDSPNQRFLSPQRSYLIMEFAEGGELNEWLKRNDIRIDGATRLNLLRDMYWGLHHLHSRDISHGDIHTGNVLIFIEPDGVIAKWTDFGCANALSGKQYRFRKTKPLNQTNEILLDIKALQLVFWKILESRDQGIPETQLETKLLDVCYEMTESLSNIRSLSELYESYSYLLADEIQFDEQYYQ